MQVQVFTFDGVLLHSSSQFFTVPGSAKRNTPLTYCYWFRSLNSRQPLTAFVASISINKHHQCFGSERGSPLALLFSSPLQFSLALLFSSFLQFSLSSPLQLSSLLFSLGVLGGCLGGAQDPLEELQSIMGRKHTDTTLALHRLLSEPKIAIMHLNYFEPDSNLLILLPPKIGVLD